MGCTNRLIKLDLIVQKQPEKSGIYRVGCRLQSIIRNLWCLQHFWRRSFTYQKWIQEFVGFWLWVLSYRWDACWLSSWHPKFRWFFWISGHFGNFAHWRNFLGQVGYINRFRESYGHTHWKYGDFLDSCNLSLYFLWLRLIGLSS